MISHALRQGPAIGATLSLLRTKAGSVQAPGPELTETVPARPRGLVDDFVRVCGGSPKAWGGRLPPYMFPQWGWALITQTLHGVPYDLTKVVNAGCSWKVNGPLPDDQPLNLRAQLTEIDDDGRRALLSVRLVTGTAAEPDLLESTLTAFCPLPKKKDATSSEQKREKKPKPIVPMDAVAIGDKRLKSNQGWRFCLVSGDFNPIHWLGPYAKMAGFGGVILHGFGTAAVAAEQVIGQRLAGDIDGLTGLSARFTRPLRLPATPTVFLGQRDGEHTPLYVGTAPGGPAFLVGDVRV